MRYVIATILVVATFAGCGPTVKQAKVEANQRWQQTRSDVIAEVAEQHLRVGQLDQAAEKAADALSLDEKNAFAHAVLGRVYIEKGNYTLAIGELDRACELDPRSAEYVYLLGVAQEKARKLEDALASYRKSFAMNGRQIEPVLAAAEVLVAMGRLREAQLYLDSHKAQGEQDPAMHELAGRVASLQEDHAAAADHYEQALALDVQNIRYREALGREQYFAGRLPAAAHTLAALEDTDEYRRPLWVLTMLGDCYVDGGQYAQARDAYTAATKREPASSVAWVRLARTELAMKDFVRAILSANRALDLQADNEEAAVILGYGLLMTRQAGKARTVLAEAVSRNPDSSMLQCLLGRAHAELGDVAQARRCYQESLRLDPQNVAARELLSVEQDKALSRSGGRGPAGG